MHAIANVFVPILVCICQINAFLIQDGIQKVTTTKYGDIIGFIDIAKFNNKNFQVTKYLGIPYAEPPIGTLRFEKPVMKENISTPFNAFKYSKKCPQMYLSKNEMSEDCLYLNIFTPDVSTTNVIEKPVMIWIHGGGFIEGYGDIFDGDVIAALADVIVVTINYRLGPLGFFSTHDSMAKGNYGLWDQQLAIRWVHENIADFAGDVNNITIFGESAGSTSVIYQMIYPGNKGLFHRAIAESGTIAAWGVAHGNSNYDMSMKFANSLGCNKLSNISNCLKGKTEQDIISKALQFQNFNEVNMTWIPIFDNDFVRANTPDILSELSNPILRSKFSNFFEVDLLIGANNYDGNVYQDLFMTYIHNVKATSISYTISQEQFANIIIPRAIEGLLGEKPTKLSTDMTIHEYTDWNGPFGSKERLQSTLDILTDYALNAPSILTAKSHLHGNKSTYFYQFKAAPPKRLMEIAPELDGPEASCHSDELPFVFGFTENLRRYWNFTDDTMIDLNAYRLSRQMILMWTNFAKTGNPNLPTPLRTAWPMYNRKDETYLEIGLNKSEVKQRLRAEHVEFLNKVLPGIQMFSRQVL